MPEKKGQYARETFKNEVAALLKDAGVFAERLENPPKGVDADISFPCFALAKEQKKNPMQIAKEIAEKIKIPKKSLIKKAEASGPYINFYADWAAIGQELLNIDNHYGQSGFGKKEKVMVEFSEPNPNKPMHIGHARNTFLGDSISRIMSAAGFNVLRVNYYNDSGIHIAKTVLGYMKWGAGKIPDKIMPSTDGKLLGTPIPKKPDRFIGEFYTKFNTAATDNPELEKEARELLKKIESGDKETIALWKKVKGWCIEGFDMTYKRLGIKFDTIFFESDFEKPGRVVVQKAIEKGIAFKDINGETVAKLKDYGMPNCIILRSDGTTLYATKDLALAAHKFEKYHVKKSIYVVGAEQEQYFQQLFKMLELLGYENAKNMHHVKNGLVMLPEGKMSSRKGLVVFLDDTIDELKEYVAEIIEKSHPQLAKKENAAEKVGIGALKFALIKTSSDKTILFNKEEVAQFDGDTGPYVQYTYARASSILRSGHAGKKPDATLLKEPDEVALLKKISEFPEAIIKSAQSYQPHLVTVYLLELTHLFNAFYQKVPVLKAENEELKNARLHLVSAVRQTIGNGLELLGIDALEEM
ncbi:MAG: arginine--tRNA ligase [Nanoarchaeota archaeon]|nr:arginine--tRNA ligase [Nanoarchaeota archaeon]MBU4452174.1 arginine--tRNA ligase [Nanoarchaeota archaeon]MCG2724214.1 arginine--tRNA ligase [archaeon]